MVSSTYFSSTPSLYPPTDLPFLLRRCNVCMVSIYTPYLRSIRSRYPGLRLAQRNIELSWLSQDQEQKNDYKGWAIVESPVQKQKKGLPKFVIGAIGASISVLLAAIAHFSLSKKGFKFRIASPLQALHEVLDFKKITSPQSKIVDSGISDEATMVSLTSPDSEVDVIRETAASDDLQSEGRHQHVMISVVADSLQQEAISVLKKLKIIEDDIKENELCNRREYARWLIRIHSLLERRPKHRILPSIALAGSVISAFDDVDTEDPDLGSIQALAEAGIIPSRLSGKLYNPNSSESEENTCFLPERFISRKDLIDWKAQLEYEIAPGVMKQISRTKLDYMDVKEISSNESPGVFMDMLAGEKSILRRVFGRSKRFQPSKPSTKAQAAVALTSGTIMDVIYSELSRLEAENHLKQAEMEEIKTALLEKGDIQRFWDKKLMEERSSYLQAERHYQEAVHNLHQGKIDNERSLAEHLKEKAAIDCQKQLLLSLREEVDKMSEELAFGRAMYVSEHLSVQNALSDLQNQVEDKLDKKSILEAEIEALRILRSWIEDEARRSQARSKILEEVAQRWKWDNQA